MFDTHVNRASNLRWRDRLGVQGGSIAWPLAVLIALLLIGGSPCKGQKLNFWVDSRRFDIRVITAGGVWLAQFIHKLSFVPREVERFKGKAVRNTSDENKRNLPFLETELGTGSDRLWNLFHREINGIVVNPWLIMRKQHWAGEVWQREGMAIGVALLGLVSNDTMERDRPTTADNIRLLQRDNVFPHTNILREGCSYIFYSVFDNDLSDRFIPRPIQQRLRIKRQRFCYFNAYLNPRSLRQCELLLSGSCGSRGSVSGFPIGDSLNTGRVRVADEYNKSEKLDTESYPFAVWAVIIFGLVIGFVGWCLIRKGRGWACVLGLALFIGGLAIFWHGLKLKDAIDERAFDSPSAASFLRDADTSSSICTIALFFSTRLKVLGCLWCPEHAYISVVRLRSIQTEIVNATDRVKNLAIVYVAQVYIVSGCPLELGELIDRYRPSPGIGWKFSTFSALRIDRGRLPSIDYKDMAYRSYRSGEGLSKIPYLDFNFTWDSISRSFRRFNAVLVHNWPSTQYLLSKARSHQHILPVSFASIPSHNTECSDFHQKTGFTETAKKIALKGFTVGLYLLLGFFFSALGVWHVQYEAPRHFDNAWNTCWLVLAFGIFLIVIGQVAFWRVLDVTL